MKKILGFISLMLMTSALYAGWDSDYVRSAGNYIVQSAVTLTANSTGTIITADTTCATIDIFNNSAYTLWIGSTSTTSHTNGFPILSSSTYTTDGRFTGTIIGYAAIGAVDVRILKYKRNAN